MGIDEVIYFLIKDVTIVKQGEAEKINLDSFPTLKQVMDQVINAGVRMSVCEQSCILLGLVKGVFIDPAIVGTSTLSNRILDADAVLSF